MTRFIALILCGVAFNTANAQRQSVSFTELNVGGATMEGYEWDNVFPGASLLFGKTIQLSNNNVTEFQIGVAFPTIVTGKVAVGVGTLEKNVMVAVRPWPLMVGPQVKRNQFTWSLELGTAGSPSFDAGWIATVGYRWDFARKDKE